tara:strand:+ start:1558 stop:4521 length:2964 start_codon:yes stop_codon:yes gene_type:complete
MDIFKEEKFEKGGVILERIHPDLDVEPYVPYYEKMGYVVSIVEKPNGWVELIGEKKDTFEDAYGRFKDDIRENFTPRKYDEGGTVETPYGNQRADQLKQISVSLVNKDVDEYYIKEIDFEDIDSGFPNDIKEQIFEEYLVDIPEDFEVSKFEVVMLDGSFFDLDELGYYEKLNTYSKGGKVGKGYKVFNYTDNIYASDETFTSVANAKKFIKDFRKRFEAQGYYRDNRQNKISPNHIDLEVIKSSFNPYRFAKGGKIGYSYRGKVLQKGAYDRNDNPLIIDGNLNIFFEASPKTDMTKIRERAERIFKKEFPQYDDNSYMWNIELISTKYPDGEIVEYSKGGRTKIENDGVDFNEEMYRGILGDRDKDGTGNADDVAPNNPEIADYIEKDTPFSKTFRTLLDDKRMYDDSMYSIIGEMEKILPQKFDIIARTKTPFSILKKLVGKKLKFKRDEYGKITNKGLTDVIGTTIATNNTNELMTVRGMIGIDEGDNGIFGEVIEVDDKYKIPLCGYRAIHYIVLYNGVPVEIQLKTKRMKMLNEFAHPFYKAEDLDCDGMGDLTEIVVMADNGSKEAQKEFADIFADKDRMRSMISKSYSKGGEVEWFDYSKIDLEELPYDLDRYFIKDADTKEIDLKLLEPTRAREKGVKNANKYMRMAYDGEIDRRKPISVYERNGKMYVFDGNSTIANAKNSGWKTIYVEMIDDPNDDYGKGGRTKDAETLREMSSALKKGSGMHKKQSEQLMGASSSHKKQAKDLDRIADKISKGYAKGGEVGSEFDYMMLGRLQNDVEYYLGHGGRSPRVLYYRDSPKEHIEAMKEIWNRLPIKPEWLPKEKLDFYEMQLLERGGKSYAKGGEVDLDYFEQSSTQTNKFRDTKGNYKDVVNTDSDKLVYEEEDLNWNFIKFAESPEFVYYVNDYELEADFDDVEENNTFEYMAIHKPSKRGGVWVGHYVDYMPLQEEYKTNALTFKHPRLDESLKKFSEDDLLFPF